MRKRTRKEKTVATGKALNGKPYAGNPHVRFDEGEVAPAATPRRGSLLYNMRKLIGKVAILAATIAAGAILPFVANADGIRWEHAKNIVGDADVRTDGVLRYAYANNAATVNGVPFADAGANGVMYEWETYGKLASDVFAGQAMSSYGNWALVNDNEVFEGQHFKLNIYGGSRKDWLVSPSIDATGVQLAAGEKLKLGFKMALAKWSSSGSVATLPDTTGTDDKFIVAFSIDNGVTWLQANATEWNNSGAPTIFNSIPNTGVDILLDLSAAAGHMLKFAFYGESTVQNADNDLHIGNITLEVIGNTTDIRNLDATDKAVKFLENGQIYIRLNGTTYDVTGRKIK